jgi:hypothetical protein
VTGLLKDFVPAVAGIRSISSSAITAASSHEDTSLSSDAEFKMGGFENLDEDGNEVVDKKYRKYAKIKTERKSGFQVRVSEILCVTVDSTFYSR